MKALLIVHLTTIAVASSYLTLGIFATSDARALWAPYGLTVLVLASLALYLDHRSP